MEAFMMHGFGEFRRRAGRFGTGFRGEGLAARA
jgi:hypothetical protein